MCNAARQQEFDTIVARFTRRLTQKFSFIVLVDHIDDVIDEIDEFKEALIDIREVARSSAYPGDTKARRGELSPINRNMTKRGGMGTMTGIEDPKPLRALLKPPQPLWIEILQYMRKLKRAVSSGEIAEHVGSSSTSVCKALTSLEEKGETKRRKAKNKEKPNPHVKFMYEVAA